jgi:hypothetical protein
MVGSCRSAENSTWRFAQPIRWTFEVCALSPVGVVCCPWVDLPFDHDLTQAVAVHCHLDAKCSMNPSWAIVLWESPHHRHPNLPLHKPSQKIDRLLDLKNVEIVSP